MAAEKSGEEKKGNNKNKRSAKKWKVYEISPEGKIKRKNKVCPKCGEGVFLAKHVDRLSCGKCSYTEFLKK